MKNRIRVEKPDDVEITLTVTASLQEWKAISKGLTEYNIPCVGFRNIIASAVEKISNQLEGDEKE